MRLLGTVSFGAPRRAPLTEGPDLGLADSLKVAGIAVLLLYLGLLPQKFLSSLERPIVDFWRDNPDRGRFMMPGDEGRATLPKVFKKEGQ